MFSSSVARLEPNFWFSQAIHNTLLYKYLFILFFKWNDINRLIHEKCFNSVTDLKSRFIFCGPPTLAIKKKIHDDWLVFSFAYITHMYDNICEVDDRSVLFFFFSFFFARSIFTHHIDEKKREGPTTREGSLKEH